MTNTEASLTSYRSWTGDLNGLVETLSCLGKAMGYGESEDVFSVRLIRYYQSLGCIGKPTERNGTKGIFGYRHILEAISVRILLSEQWKLSRIGGAIAEMSDDALERLVLARMVDGVSLSDGARPDDKVSASGVSNHDLAREALALISSFETDVGKRTSSLKELPGKPYSQKSAFAKEAQMMTECNLSPWLRISVDKQALAQAEPGLVKRVLTEAYNLLDNLKS